jgi:hypothetical protein
MNDLFLDPTPNIFGDSEIGHGIHDFVQGGYNLFVINNRMSFEEAHSERSHKNKTNLEGIWKASTRFSDAFNRWLLWSYVFDENDLRQSQKGLDCRDARVEKFAAENCHLPDILHNQDVTRGFSARDVKDLEP